MRQNELLTWLTVGGVCAVVLALVIAIMRPSSSAEQTVASIRFFAAASQLSITDSVRSSLRQEFSHALNEMERNLCDNSLREIAGQTAVAYYEALVEKPVIKAGLQLNRRGICEPANGSTEPLTLSQFNPNGLRLPWDCMPGSWRTPLDLALQAKLEQYLRSGVLTSESLTGTLSALAKPSFDSAFNARCTHSHNYLTSSQNNTWNQLPVLAGPRYSRH